MSTQVAGRVPEWTLGDRLRKARQVTGMTTRQFATEIGVAQGTVTGAENDTRQPRRITLLAYAMRTGVPIEWIETGETPTGTDPDGGGKWAHWGSNPEPAGSLYHLAATATARELVAA